MIKPILTGLVLSVFVLGFTTEIYGNLFHMLEGADSFFIPVQSDIWSFEVTKSNPGSGSWWLFGQDHQHYYALSMQQPEYLYILRDNSCVDFDPQQIETWCAYQTSPLPYR